MTSRWRGVDGDRKRAVLFFLLSEGTHTIKGIAESLPLLPNSRPAVYQLMELLVSEGLAEKTGKVGREVLYAATDHALTIIKEPSA
jgi:predicted ArsR family transcriptional regulator